ncbi:MAG: HTH-type transcriptional regulator in the ttuE-ttuCintergenic region [Rhodospirillales bacterium]|nr:HTH-type transcriptional regulator in the ttuE-ttuCintergenic region [Rhodospirillales bacterium]
MSEPAALRPSRQSLVEQALEEMRRRILSNEWPANFTALEGEIAIDLGMSRTPVREALVQLESQGLMSLRPRHGMQVLPISADDMVEIYAIITSLEATAAELAARRELTEEELSRLEGPVRLMEIALEQDDRHGWAIADEEFHRTLVALSGNRRLKAMIASVSDQAHRVRMTMIHRRPKPVVSTMEHRMLVDALRRGDAEGARELQRLHRRRGGEVMIGILRSNAGR